MMPLGTDRLVSFYQAIIDEINIEKAPKEEPVGEIIK